jgi:hypothetical protein
MSGAGLVRSSRQIVLPLDRDAEEIGELYRKSNTAIIESVCCRLECGHRLTKKKIELGYGNFLPWVKANADVLGFDVRAAQFLMRGAAKYEAGFVCDENEALAISKEMWGHPGPVRGTAGTGEFERYTPAEYIEAARTVLGGIDLDPASCELAQRTVKAERYFTFHNDGLAHPWHSRRLWLNPPYHRKLCPLFVDKLIAEYATGNVTAAIMLTNNCTDTTWFLRAVRASSAIAFTTDRINFLREDGETLLDPTQGQTFFYFGDDVARFAEVFQDFCYLVELYRPPLQRIEKLLDQLSADELQHLIARAEQRLDTEQAP